MLRKKEVGKHLETLEKKQLTEFDEIIKDLEENETVQEMKKYIQHCDTTCYDHCRNVAYHSYLICKKYGLDYRSAARGGMLHDLFLYNWRKSQREVTLHGLHAFEHPKIALMNSMKLFDLNEMEKDIILKHMWPVTIRFPKYKESYIITLVDKYSAVQETFQYIKEKQKMQKWYRYACVFLSMLILRF